MWRHALETACKQGGSSERIDHPSPVCCICMLAKIVMKDAMCSQQEPPAGCLDDGDRADRPAHGAQLVQPLHRPLLRPLLLCHHCLMWGLQPSSFLRLGLMSGLASACSQQLRMIVASKGLAVLDLSEW